MLTPAECQRILNEDAELGYAYTLEEAERLRGVLYQIARIHLHHLRTHENSAALHTRLDD